MSNSWVAWASGEVYVKDVIKTLITSSEKEKAKEATTTTTSEPIIMVKATDSIVNVLDVLAKNNISSAPVLSQQGVIGFIDMLDIVAFAMDKIDKNNPPKDVDLNNTLTSTLIADVINFSKRNEFQSIDPNAHVYVLIQMLSNPNVHRVAVTKAIDTHQFCALITQYDLVQWLYYQKDKANDILRLTVQDLWPESSPLISIRQSESVYSAFETICQKQISGIAVVDDKERLVGNISASDLKYSGCLGNYSRNLHTLIKDIKGSSIESFLHLGQQQGRQDTGVCPAIGTSVFGEHMRKNPEQWKPVCVTKNDTLGHVMELVLNTKNINNNSHIHRVYITDEETKKPLHVISLSDIIAQFQVYHKH
jgi:CBS domain-containing protein